MKKEEKYQNLKDSKNKLWGGKHKQTDKKTRKEENDITIRQKKEQLNFTILQGRQMPSLIEMFSQPKTIDQPAEVQAHL